MTGPTSARHQGAISVIVPAHDEASHIAACLAAIWASDPVPTGGGQVVVVANGCRDDTAHLAAAQAGAAARAGWDLVVLDRAEGGKLAALDAGEAVATGRVLAYLDADVRLDPPLLAALARVLDGPQPRYGSGRPRVTPAHSRLTAAYARFWSTLPFLQTGVPGFGVFAMNRAGRDRWGAWPRIISDDTFARLNFAPTERVAVAAGYSWPMVEGFVNLVRVRRRQDRGVAEIAARFPDLLVNDDKSRLGAGGLLRRALRDPSGFAAYVAVTLAVRSPLWSSTQVWTRGR